jgi:hypothetical protein
MTVAVVGLIKTLSKDKLGDWAMLVAVGVAFAIVFLGLNGVITSWVEFVQQSLYVGLGAAGSYKIAGKIGNS